MEQLTVTAKIQISVDADSKVLLDETMSVYSDACNYVSDYVFRTHDLKQFSLNKVLYSTLREKFELKSQMAQSVFKTVIARYKTILENQKEWIQPSFKKPQYDLVWNRDYSLTQNCFSVNTRNGRVKLPYFAEGMSKYFDHTIYKFGTAKLVNKHGKKIKQKRAHYSKLRKELQMRQTPSARRRVKAIGQRENRWIQDVNHQVSKALVENNPKHTLFVLEDLSGVRNATERVRTKDRYVSVSWSFYDLEQKLTYKAKQNQSTVIKVNPRYTSQCCPVCGHIEKANRDKKIRLFTCKNCGYKSNDDRIGAMNLYRMGINYLEDSQVPDTVTAE